MIITKKKKITAKDTEGWLKSTQKAKEIKKLWSDGYDVGDISKTILKTGNVAVNSASDAMVNIGKGTFTAAEGIVDAARYKIGDVFKKSANWQADMWEKAGYKDYAKGLRKSGQQIYDYEKSNATMNVTGALLGETNDIFKKNWSKKVDENSILDSKADSVMQGVGQVGFNIGAGYLTGGSSLSTFGTTFASAYGNARSEAYNNGADDKTAKTTGLISGLSEAISEQVFSGIPGLKTAGWGDKVIGKIGKSVENYFGSSTGKAAIKALDAIGEGSEEIISNVLTSIGNNIAHNINEKYTYGMENQSGNILEDIKTELTSQESWDAFISAMLTSAITNGGVDIVNNKRNNSAIKSYAKENNITAEQAKQLFNEVAQKNANQEVTSNYKERVELEEQVKNRLATNIKENIKTGNNKINLEEMRNVFLSKENFMKSVGTKYKENNKEVYKTSSEGLNLIDSYRAYNGNENKISEINNIQKYMEGRNIDSRFDATMFENEKQNAFWQTKDGKSTVIFNPNATQEQIIEEIATHEMTHDIINQKTETGTSLFSDVLEYAKSTENYANTRKDLEKSYSKYYDTTSKDFSQKIDEEIVANTLGKQLGTQEYINRIVNNNPNIAQKIYRWVVDKLQTSNTIKDNNNNVTGFKSERLYWEGVKNRFEKAYNEAKLNNDGIDTKYGLFSKKKEQGKINYNISEGLIKEIDYKTKEANKNNKSVKYIDTDAVYDLINKKGERTYDEQKGLFEYIKQRGIEEPIRITNKDGKYEIVDGNHRVEISHNIGLKKVPVVYDNFFGDIDFKNETWYNQVEERYHEKRNVKIDEKNKNESIDHNRSDEIGKYSGENGKSDKIYQTLSKNNNRSSTEAIYSNNAIRRTGPNVEDGNFKYSLNSREELDNSKELDISSYLINDEIGINSLESKNNDLIPLKGTKTKMSELFSENLVPIREDIKAVSKQMNNLSKQIETLQNQTENNSINSDIAPVRKALNPAEIANLKVEDANTTPNLPNKSYEKGTKKSKFYKNITEKTQMLPETARTLLSDENNIQYYKDITNEESMNEALKRLQKDGASETNRWFNQKSESATANDVAEGWILLKQYSDNKDYDNMIQVAKKMRDIGSAAGQTVQAFNIMSRLTPEGMVKYAQSELTEAYNQMVKNKSQDWINKNMKDFDLTPGDVEFIMNTMEKVQTMQDGYEKRVELAKIQKLMTDKIPSNAGNKIKAWMRISMLFNPKTQVRNVVGNAIMLPVNYFSDIVSNYADKAIQKQTGIRTTGTYNIKAMLKGMKEGAYQATNDYKLGINTKNMDGNRFEIGEGKSFNEKSAIGRALNRTESMLNYVMDAGDRVFSQAVFENSLANQQALNKTTKITQEMIDIATTESLQRTWNDNNNYTKFVLDIRSKLNSLPSIKGYGLGDILIPFAKTPANLTKAIVDYSPVGLVSTINQYVKLKNNISTGTVTSQQQHQFVQSLGKATAGSMLYIIAYALAKAGIANGASDDDKDTANFLKNTLGISSYSIKIGGKSFTYDWAQPIAAPLSIMTNITDKSKETTLYEAIIGNLDSATSVLMEQSFLESINDVLNGNGGTVDNLMQQVYELPSRAVPTFVKQMADMVDGTQRQTYVKDAPLRTATNKTISKIPFLSKTLDASVDTMGRDIEKYGGKNNIFNVFLNPATVNTENISSAAKEIYNVYKETGNNSVMPKVAPYYINSNNEKIILSTEERTKYQRVAGNIVEENVNNLIKNGVYNSLSSKDKANIINDIVNYSYNIARKEALGMDLPSTYNSAYKYSEIGDISDYYLYKNTTADEDSQEKKKKITEYLTNSNLSNNQIAYLYGLNYSNETTLNSLVNANISIKEFIKLNSTTITSDYDKKGNTIANSRKKKYISYVNSLNLTIPQKAMLIKMEYSSYKNYDKQIVSYVNKQNLTKFEKASILKKTNFDNYDDYIVDYILNTGKTGEEMEEMLKNLGFKIRNGKIYG